MTPKTPPPERLVPASVDRVRLIRCSLRCFWFGVMGAVPLLGLGPACLNLRLQRQLAQETGDPAHIAGAKMPAISGVAFVLAILLLCLDRPGLVLALGLLLSGLPGCLLFRIYRRTEPRQWNPARHLVCWGAGLACAGLVLSSTIILLSLDNFIRMIGS